MRFDRFSHSLSIIDCQFAREWETESLVSHGNKYQMAEKRRGQKGSGEKLSHEFYSRERFPSFYTRCGAT